MLTLEIQQSSLQITILRCSGRIVKGDGADELLQAALSQRLHCIQIDLSAVAAIDAAGLGVLARLESWARTEKRRMFLVNPSPPVREALDTTGLSSVLETLPAPREGHAA